MLKLLTAVSLIALLTGGDTSQPTSYGPALIILLAIGIGTALILRYLHKHFQIVRRSLTQKFQRGHTRKTIISDKAWKRIVSGEMARELMRREDR